MRVLLISADFPPVQSGEANHTFYLAQHLSRLGLEVHVLTSRIEGVQAEPGLTVYPVMRSWTWFEIWRFVSFVRRCSPDVVLLVFLGAMYHHHPMMTFAATLARVVCPAVRCVTQFEHLGVDIWTNPWATRLVRKLMALWAGRTGADYEYGTLLRDSNAVIVLSEMHRTCLAERFPALAYKSSLIPPPPLIKMCRRKDTLREETRRRLGVGEGECLLIYYGYVYHGKGLDTLLSALRLLADWRLPVRLLAVGGPLVHVSSPEEAARSTAYFVSVQRMAEELEVCERVIWAGPVAGDSDETSTFLHAADVCVLPFDRGLHLNNSSFAAAAIHGLPVISTRCPTTESVFRDQENVLLCSPRSPLDFARAVEAVVTSQPLRETLATGVQKLANDWFSWEKAARRTIETLATGTMSR
jgi:glycosyltransferase involved in cell wall biosynthesis